ncbi:MAG: molybdopterin molybdotransferase MoeA [Gammaproteobacteria bacterium]|nr:molybdopterin molybdotransferase MoeA [Gammaproteobacteria bacterium]
MLTVAEASRAIAEAMPAYDAVPVALDDARGRILRQTVSAERDQPPFDRVTMDGIAIDFNAWETGTRAFNIQGTQHAGDHVTTLAEPGNCIEIMTGGVLPRGTDCVIAVERLTVEEGVATVEQGYGPARHQFVHPQGSDYRNGDAVLQPGSSISPMDIAIIASCGLEEVRVNRQPAVRVISTGNELVAPGKPIELHQVRLSNGPALVAMLAGQGFDHSAHEHIEDNRNVLRNRLSALLANNDVLVLSGGVSMGKADFVPGVLASLGVKVVFHKISQRPGKPMWFGIGPDNQAVFALPGNPVSSLVCCRQYVLPALYQAAGREAPEGEYAVLAEDISFKADLTCFQPVRLTAAADAKVAATPVTTNTSGDFASLSGTDGYVELAKEESEFSAGSVVPLHRWTAP